MTERLGCSSYGQEQAAILDVPQRTLEEASHDVGRFRQSRVLWIVLIGVLFRRYRANQHDPTLVGSRNHSSRRYLLTQTTAHQEP